MQSLSYIHLIIEMIVVGLALVFISLLVSYGTEYVMKGDVELLPPHFLAMVTGTFISGALLHLLFEYFGINQYYVSQYEPYFT